MAVQLQDAEAETLLPAGFLTGPYEYDHHHIDLSLGQSVEVQGGFTTYDYEPPCSGFGSRRSSAAAAMFSPRPSEFFSSESIEDDYTRYRELSRQMTRCMIHDKQKLPSTSIIATHQDPKFQENRNFNIIPKRSTTDAAWPQNIQGLKTPNSSLTTLTLNYSKGMHTVKQQGPKFKQENFEQGHHRGRASGGGSNYARCSNRHVGITPSAASAWPPLQHPANSSSGMRVMFLGGSNRTSSKSSGTGVFLPPGLANSSESPRKKQQGCSTVLIPTKVVQALKLHFHQMSGGLSPSNSAAGTVQYQSGGSIDHRIKGLVPHSNRHPRTTTMMSQLPTQPEMGLPHDWTY